MYKNIEVLFKSSIHGELLPLKFKVDDEYAGTAIIKLYNPILIEESRHAGNRLRVYDCQAESNGYMRPCRLAYEVDSCTWMLMKLG